MNHAARRLSLFRLVKRLPNSYIRLGRRRRRARPKAWPARLKFYANKPWERLFGKPLFGLGVYEIFGDPPEWQRRVALGWRHAVRDTSVPHALLLLLACLAILVGWYVLAPAFFPDAWVEFIGLTYDVFFILVLFALFEHGRQRRVDARRQQEIIDDYRKWDSDEARFRIAGAIRRLIESGRTSIDFGGIELRDLPVPPVAAARRDFGLDVLQRGQRQRQQAG